jgi:hypothetical protein
MQKLSRPLLFETWRYYPQALVSLSWTSVELRTKCLQDLSFVHTMVEELFTITSCRELNFSEWVSMIRERRAIIGCDLEGNIYIHDLDKKTTQQINISWLEGNTGPGFAFCSYDEILICGINYIDKGHDVYMLNCRTEQLERKADMTQFRSAHAVQTYNRSVYVFGGTK